MIPILRLIHKLQQYPSHARVFAYEGEGIGIVIVDDDRMMLGFIEASGSDEDDHDLL